MKHSHLSYTPSRWQRKKQPDYLNAELLKEVRAFLRDHTQGAAMLRFDLTQHKLNRLLSEDWV